MAQPAPVMPPPLLEFHKRETEEREVRFECILLAEQVDEGKRRSATLMVSLAVHAALIALVVLIPILTYNVLPVPSEGTRAFFVAPPEAAPPPPPPPPPPAGAQQVVKAPAAPIPDEQFVAPTEVPDEIRPEPSYIGVPEGIAGGVEGGVPGGVLGGVVGVLAPPPPAPVAVRVGGQIKAPKLVHVVPPIYPELAAQARLTAVVIAEALVDTTGRVREVQVLRGAPLFDEAATVAVKQWRYQPLLLNGVPTEFILTVTVKFNLSVSTK